MLGRPNEDEEEIETKIRVKGREHMTSAKFSEFFTPSLLVTYRNPLLLILLLLSAFWGSPPPLSVRVSYVHAPPNVYIPFLHNFILISRLVPELRKYPRQIAACSHSLAASVKLIERREQEGRKGRREEERRGGRK